VVGGCSCVNDGSGFLCFLLLFVGGDSDGNHSGDAVGRRNSEVDSRKVDGRIACIDLIIVLIMSSANMMHNLSQTKFRLFNMLYL